MKSEKKIYPKFSVAPHMMFNAIKKIDHPFLQAIVDHDAVLVLLQGEFTVFADRSLVLLFIYDDHVEIECISTPASERGKGSATNVMNALCEIADETDTIITLRTANVVGNGFNMIPQHMVVAHGMNKKGKIPVPKLKQWYEKFGFFTTKKEKSSYHMKRVPVKQWEREMKVQHTNPQNN